MSDGLKVPLARPEITEEDIDSVVAVLRTPILSGGAQLPAFEQAMAQYAGVRHGVAVNSGTSALHIVLRSYQFQPGDEVIVPSFAFVAVGNVLLQEGLTPVFVDIEDRGFNLDLRSAELAITAKTKAILLVHTFGFPADVEGFRQLATDRDLVLIEDASEALGASLQGKRVGCFGDVGIFAFYPNKAITTGEGGIVVTSDDLIAARCRRLRNQGREPSSDWYQHHEVGFSYRLAEMNCALGLSQVRRIDSVMRRRNAVAGEYGRRLADVPGLGLPSERSGVEVGWFTYPVLLIEGFTMADRDLLWSQLNARGIGCARYFAPLHKQPVMQGRCRVAGDLRRTASLAERVFQLPFFTEMSSEQVAAVCGALGDCMERFRS